MEEFLNKLYSYEYFGTYLMIAIAVLVLLFIIVLFFGKKDQKKREIEETKKLQQINNTDAFKEENSVASVEVPNEEVTQEPVVTQEQLENDTIVVPNINDLAANDNNVTNTEEIPEPVLPHEEVVNTYEPVSDNTFSNESNTETNEVTSEPILDKVEEKPLVFNDVPNEEPAFDMPDVNIEPTTPLVDVPDFNFDEIANGIEEIKEENTVKPAEVFSSVYAPQNEEVELPKLEEEKAKEEDIELPTLKKEEKIEKPELNDYNLDNITGEDYNLNK